MQIDDILLMQGWTVSLRSKITPKARNGVSFVSFDIEPHYMNSVLLRFKCSSFDEHHARISPAQS